MVVLSRWHPASHGHAPRRRAEHARLGRSSSPRSGAARAYLGVAGNVAVEFALALPVLMLLMLGSAEMARFVILHQKVDRVAVTTSDLVARAETIKESELDDIFAAAEYVAQPFDLPNLGIVIVSAITNEDGDGPTVAWQRSGAGSASHTSQIGVEGGAATLFADFEVREGETAIIAEVFYDFEPFLSELIVEPQTLYRRAHHRPRLGTLEEIGAG
jgi:Flp pilus assembly protein TadG